MSGTRATLRNTGTAINKTAAITGVAPFTLPIDPAAESSAAAAASDAASQPAAPADPMQPPAETPAAPAQPAKAAAPGSPLYVGGFGSRHPVICNIAFGDGSVRTISGGISGKVLEQLGHRNDGSLHDDSAF
jgi:prepilin-type processing-associated H-X9-DG protein